MPDPIVTLTSDFGTSDHFVGVMKGVILGITPGARIVDITHDIPPFDLTAGAFAISQAWSYFPKKTIHVVVIDPGVGSARRPLLVEAMGHYFVAPDNGVLSMIYSREKHKVRHITATRYFRQPLSRTFHGRDIFSPTSSRRSPPTSRAVSLLRASESSCRITSDWLWISPCKRASAPGRALFCTLIASET